MKINIRKPLYFSLRSTIYDILCKIIHESDAYDIVEALPIKSLDSWIDLMLHLYRKEDAIVIEKHDTWSADYTLSRIIVPLLSQYRKELSGYPAKLDLRDVPENMRNEEDMMEAWEYILDEIIWAFSQKEVDWESQFFVLKVPAGSDFSKVVWEKHDKKGHDKYYRRIQKGYKLFAKYYDNFWE